MREVNTVPLGVDDAWAAFNDIEGIAPCLPGASITSVEGDEFTGAAKVKLGPISMRYQGTVRFVERDHANVVSWNNYDRGGHWSAHDAPDLLIGDIRQFFRDLK